MSLPGAPGLSGPLLRKAVNLAQALEDPPSRARALAEQAPRVAALGRPDEALELADQAIEAEAWPIPGTDLTVSA
jgi:hypothetical protein